MQEAHRLFPAHRTIYWRQAEVEECPRFTVEQLHIARKSLKMKKAPGPDRITNELVKMVT